MKRVDEADVIKGKMPHSLYSIWQGATTRPRPPRPKRKRSYYRALLRDEPWALRLKEHRERCRSFYTSLGKAEI